MKDLHLLLTGVGGTLLTGICCFTPVAVLGLAALGASAWIGWLDYVLLPLLAFFLLLTFIALRQRYRT